MKTRQTAQERKDAEEKLRKEWEADIKQQASEKTETKTDCDRVEVNETGRDT